MVSIRVEQLPSQRAKNQSRAAIKLFQIFLERFTVPSETINGNDTAIRFHIAGNKLYTKLVATFNAADIDLTDKDLEKAATRIQASYRNFTARKKQPEGNPNSTEKQAEPEKNEVPEPTVNDKGENQEEENLDDIDLNDPQVEKAAVKIQSTFRGYKTRKEVKVDGKPLENGEKGEDED
ncbi:hypothetical protein AVEN_168014-1 [Araneus ventricosus]|uniref:Uncharacterized protein n=1 Tax=Araneus ventricosus TaxID=182803 RepID=A0A4Y2JUQ7_ARAVE|nr:hypothetical protein AVEN_168014-1 [Araneus ventricosus]